MDQLAQVGCGSARGGVVGVLLDPAQPLIEHVLALGELSCQQPRQRVDRSAHLLLVVVLEQLQEDLLIIGEQEPLSPTSFVSPAATA